MAEEARFAAQRVAVERTESVALAPPQQARKPGRPAWVRAKPSRAPQDVAAQTTEAASLAERARLTTAYLAQPAVPAAPAPALAWQRSSSGAQEWVLRKQLELVAFEELKPTAEASPASRPPLRAAPPSRAKPSVLPRAGFLRAVAATCEGWRRGPWRVPRAVDGHQVFDRHPDAEEAAQSPSTREALRQRESYGRLLRDDCGALCRSLREYAAWQWNGHRIWWPELVAVGLLAVLVGAAACREGCGQGSLTPAEFAHAFSECHAAAEQMERPAFVRPTEPKRWEQLEGPACIGSDRMPVSSDCLPGDSCCGEYCRVTGEACHCPLGDVHMTCEDRDWVAAGQRASSEDCALCCGTWAAARLAQGVCVKPCLEPLRLEGLAAAAAVPSFLGAPTRRGRPAWLFAVAVHVTLAVALRGCDLDCAGRARPFLPARALLAAFVVWDRREDPGRTWRVPFGWRSWAAGLILSVAAGFAAWSSERSEGQLLVLLAAVLAPPVVGGFLTLASARITDSRRFHAFRRNDELVRNAPKPDLRAAIASRVKQVSVRPIRGLPESPAVTGLPLEQAKWVAAAAADATRSIAAHIAPATSDNVLNGYVEAKAVPLDCAPAPMRLIDRAAAPKLPVARVARLRENAWLQPRTASHLATSLHPQRPPNLGAPTA